jgi:DNA modification methylase
VFWHNGKKTKNSGELNRDWFVGNVAASFGDKVAHPCPRPFDTMKYLVSIAVKENGLVLDPFMGSGTTLLAARVLGRRAIGIELEEKYCALAVRRLEHGKLAVKKSFEPLFKLS